MAETTSDTLNAVGVQIMMDEPKKEDVVTEEAPKEEEAAPKKPKLQFREEMELKMTRLEDYIDSRIDAKIFPFSITFADRMNNNLDVTAFEMLSFTRGFLRQYETKESFYRVTMDLETFEDGVFTRPTIVNVVHRKSRMASCFASSV